jgi:hypothetical protein
VRSAEGAVAQNDVDVDDCDLAAWREEIRRHALLGLARRPVKPPRLLRIGAFVALLLMHVVLLLGLRDAMRVIPKPEESAIQVTWIDLRQPEPPLPLPEIKPHATGLPATPRHVSAPSPVATGPSGAAPTTAEPVLHVYNVDGSVMLPRDLSTPADHGSMQASFVPQSTAPSPIMRPQRPLKVRPNHFAGNWQAPRGETLLGSFVREHLTAQTEFVMPWGTHVKCGLVVVVGGCSWGPGPVWMPTWRWQPATMLDEE